MCYRFTSRWEPTAPPRAVPGPDRGRLVTDGGRPEDGADGEDATDGDAAGDGDDAPAEAGTADDAVSTDDGGDDGSGDDRTNGSTGDAGDAGESAGGPDGADAPGADRSNVEVTDEAEPATPEWEEPDLESLPEFELGAEGPLTKGAGGGSGADDDTGRAASPDPAAGKPNTARSPAATRISSEGTEAYVVAFEVCARLPDDVRLPEEAADLVPAAVEAELEQDVQQFAASEFGTERPHVDTLAFEEVDGEIWLRLRIGLPADGFAELDPEAVRSYALERLEGVL